MLSATIRTTCALGKMGTHVLLILAWCFVLAPAAADSNQDYNITEDEVTRLVRRWSPLVWLAPGERFMPDGVPEFLRQVIPTESTTKKQNRNGVLPKGTESKNWYLAPDTPIEQLLQNNSSFLYGRNPQNGRVPVYAVIKRCNSHHINSIESSEVLPKYFHVTYWFFYPYSEGKDFCTLNFRFLGSVPIPQIFNKCLGKHKTFGNHIGDWEHVSMSFKGLNHPEDMYVSTHDAGVYYKYDRRSNVFKYSKQDTRRGMLQKPNFPKFVQVKERRPVLFSAKGSHGLWSMPGVHRFVRLPRLMDTSGFGTAWETWKNLEVIDYPYLKPSWLHYQGRWGTPKSHCLPLKKVGIDICEFNDGPTGIPLKRLNFVCPKK